MKFTKDGRVSCQRVILTDGGVYDNLGLAPLWPDRVPEISLHVDKYDRIIACRAGYGLTREPPAFFWPSRMLGVLYSALARAENLSVKRLFDLSKTGVLKGVLLPFLDQFDETLAFPPHDLVTKNEIADYPTDFSAMSENWINLISRRGEQLTLALLKEHWPELL